MKGQTMTPRMLKWWNVQTITPFKGTPRPISILADCPEDALEKAQRELEQDSYIDCKLKGVAVQVPVYFIIGVWPDDVKENGVWQRRSAHLRQLVEEENSRRILN